MKLSSVPNLRSEDFGADEQAFTSKLFVQLNPFIQAVNQVFLQNVDFNDNIKSVVKDYDITTFQSFSFTWPFTDAVPAEVRVIKAVKGTSQVPTILLCAWSFDKTTRAITVHKMVEVGDSSVSPLSGRYMFSLRAVV